MRSPQISVFVLRSAFILTVLLFSHTGYGVTFSVTPNSITDQYSGIITLQIAGLNSGETVTIQRYVDANTNGVVDAPDFLWESFQLADNQGPPINAGVTNINVPGDLNTAIGTITAHLNPVIESFGARIVAQYIFVVSSPTSRFSPVTALFTVTPFFTRQSISGNVTCNGTNVPNAIILLVSPQSQSNTGFKPYGGAMANNAGTYSLKVAPGNYSFAAFKYGFVTDTTKPASVTVPVGGAVSANLSLIPATETISGKLVDVAISSLGLPGLLLGAQSSAGLFSLASTDSGGNFSLSVTSGQWGIGLDESGLDLLDYVSPNSEFKADTSAGSVAGLTFGFPKATAYIYGSVRDAQNNPLPAVRLSGDNAQGGGGAYNGDAATDQNGNYVMAVNAGLWSPSVGGSGKNPTLANYIISSGPAWTFNNGGDGTNLSAGTVAQANFFALPATNSITGMLKDGGGNPIANVQVYAFSTINGNTFNQSANTDSQGNFAFNVGNGSWTVGVNCCANCGGNSLPPNYPCPTQQTVNILSGNGVANFLAAVASSSSQISGTLTDSSGHPIPNIQLFALPTIDGVTFPAPNTGAITDANGNYSLSVTNGTWTVVVSCCGGGIGNNCGHALDSNTYHCPNQQIVHISNGNAVANFVAITGATYQISGSVKDNNDNGVTGLIVTASPSGNAGVVVTAVTGDGGNFFINVATGIWIVSVDCNGLSSRGFACVGNQNVQVDNSGNFTSFTVQACGPLQLTATTLNPGFIGLAYSFQLPTSGCHPPFTWSLSPGSLALPQGLSLSANGTVDGSPSIAGTNYFSARVTDGQGNKADGLVSIAIYPKLRITNSSLPNGTLSLPYSAQIMATGGTSAFFGANVASGTLPPGLTLSFDGNIFGTPTQLGVFPFVVQVNDNSGSDNAQAPFTIVIAQPNLQITSTSLTATLGLPFSFQLQTSGGTAPFVWSVALGSQPLPAGLTLSGGGLVSGPPAAAGVSTMIIRVTDANSLTATASVQITVTPALTLPKLSSPIFSVSNGFQFAVNAPTGQSYTVQYSVELTNWLSLFVTNPPVAPFTVVDRGAPANQHRFYRLVLPLE